VVSLGEETGQGACSKSDELATIHFALGTEASRGTSAAVSDSRLGTTPSCRPMSPGDPRWWVGPKSRAFRIGAKNSRRCVNHVRCQVGGGMAHPGPPGVPGRYRYTASTDGTQAGEGKISRRSGRGRPWPMGRVGPDKRDRRLMVRRPLGRTQQKTTATSNNRRSNSTRGNW